MGLFDRIRGDDEEVELRPPAGSAERDRETEIRAQEDGEDDDEEAFLLPGMDSSGLASDEDGEADRDGRRDRRERTSRRDAGRPEQDDRLERIIEQNDRIIELLEDVAETGDDADIWG